jgi:beta-glucosidase/6-phospho-beta-glucosidase/beta-galactosidase
MSTLFSSFWLAGFESACHINSSGHRLDMIAATQHDVQVAEDYFRVRDMGISSVREAVRWHLMEHAGKFDFSSLAPMLETAERLEIEVSWTLCHYGWPEDVEVFEPRFIDRFARFCREVARFIKDHSGSVPIYTPINEISFLCWGICHTEVMFPYASGCGGRDGFLKQQLVRAAIAGCEAIWDIEPRARIVHVDPIIHIIAPPGRRDLEGAAEAQRLSQFEAWDMLCGKAKPELGGDKKYLGIVGVNYYHSNQWEYLTNDRLHWHLKDMRRRPLHDILAEVHSRYECPLFVAETSHIGVGRGEWVREIASDVRIARERGVPVGGICLYPIIDRHDWENPNHWHNSGLWDLKNNNGRLERVLCEEYAADFRVAQAMLQGELS